MAVVLSRNDIDRFTPPAQNPAATPRVYLIAPLTWRERAACNAEITRAGIRWRTDGDVHEAVRAAVLDLAPGNADELLGVVDAWVEALRQRAEADADPSAPVTASRASDDDASGDDQEAAAPAGEALSEFETARLAYADLEAATARHPLVAEVLADRQMFFAVAPGIAASHALRGWDGIAQPFRRRAGVVPDDLLGRLPAGDLSAVGWRAFALMRPGDDEKKD